MEAEYSKEEHVYRNTTLFDATINFSSVWRSCPWRDMASSFRSFLDHTPQSVELLWTGDQLTHNTPNKHAPGGIRNPNLSM
jgi:hypothetical protein